MIKCYKCEESGSGKYRWCGGDDWICAKCANLTNGHPKRMDYSSPANPKKGLVKDPRDPNG
jgi:hypothetical protein